LTTLHGSILAENHFNGRQHQAQRTDYVTNSENSLIERLDALSQRESSVEQSEVNAGLRKD
jgi:hypothetical protein